MPEKLYECKVCHEPVAGDAKRCPHCGTYAPSEGYIKRDVGRTLKVYFFTIGLLAAALIVFLLVVRSK